MHIRSLAIPLLVAELLMGCSRPSEKMLIGKWKAMLPPDTAGVIFLRADHVLLGLRDGEIVARGHWRVAGNQLYQSVEASGYKPAVPEFAWKILELHPDRLRVHTTGETEITYLRTD